MSRGLGWCNAIYWVGLTLWIGLIISALVSRVGAEAVLTDMGLTIDDYLAYDVTQHGAVAVGKVMEPIVTFVDLAQLPMAAVVLLMVVLQTTLHGIPLRVPIRAASVLCLALAAALFAVRALFVMPSLNRTMRAYWEAARLAQADSAANLRDSLEAVQPAATWLMSATLALLLVAVILSPRALAAAAQAPPAMEPPALLRRSP